MKVNPALVMPALGMGTFRLADDTAYRAVSMALDVGYRHIDTAQIYGNEVQVGQAIKDSGVPRSDIFITTKVWNSQLAPGKFLPSVEESLEKLQVDAVDLLLIHWPSPEDNTSMESYLDELQQAKHNGLTQHIGVSNFTIANLKQALEVLPASEIFTNQVEVHPYLTNLALREFCAANGIHITGYMPFAVGKVLKDETIMAIAEQHNATPAQVVIAWMLAQGMATIPSSTKRENLQANIAGESLALSEDEMAAITALDRNDRQANPEFSPAWD